MRPYFGAFGVFVSAVALTFATAQTPAAQQKTAPAGPPPKKNPLLKLAEPWPEADVLKQRKKEAEERPLFKSTDPLEFTLTGPFNTINKDHNPESTKRYPGVLTVAGADGARARPSPSSSARADTSAAWRATATSSRCGSSSPKDEPQARCSTDSPR